MGSVPVLVSVVTVAYVVLNAPQGGFESSPRRVSVIAWLIVITVLAAFAAVSRSPMRRSVTATIAGVGMLVSGVAGLMTIGLPLALAGVVETLYVFSSAEAAAVGSNRVWTRLVLAALGTVGTFMFGLAASPL